LLEDVGVLKVTHNWTKPGWTKSVTNSGTLTDDGTWVLGSAPGFIDHAAQDFRLAVGTACLNAGTTLAAAVLPGDDVTGEYVKHRGSTMRPNDGVFDIGAYELRDGQPQDLAVTTASLPSGQTGTSYSATISAAGGVPPYLWSIASGSLPAGRRARCRKRDALGHALCRRHLHVCGACHRRPITGGCCDATAHY
jgi:hypothetical protein